MRQPDEGKYSAFIFVSNRMEHIINVISLLDLSSSLLYLYISFSISPLFKICSSLSSISLSIRLRGIISLSLSFPYLCQYISLYMPLCPSSSLTLSLSTLASMWQLYDRPSVQPIFCIINVMHVAGQRSNEMPA